jgi:transcriptional regulator with XRE-family HTH domain
MSRDKLLKELRNRNYRRSFVESHARESIAYQLKQMRKRKNWTGKELAAALGNEKLQPMISRYENPDYGKYTVSTLLQLADVFDVGLVVRFAPFSELVHWDSRMEREDIVPVDYDHDRWLHADTEDEIVEQLVSEASDTASDFTIERYSEPDVAYPNLTGIRTTSQTGNYSSFDEHDTAEQLEMAI